MKETSLNDLLTAHNSTSLNHTAVTDGKLVQAIVILNTRNPSFQTHLQPDMRQPSCKTKCIIQREQNFHLFSLAIPLTIGDKNGVPQFVTH